MMDVVSHKRTVEMRHAVAWHEQQAAEEAAGIRRHAWAVRFAKSFPEFAAEVSGKLKALEAKRLAAIPEQDWQTRRLVQVATLRAWTDTMLDGRDRLAAARRGPGNRHDRRAAQVKQVRELVEWGRGFRGKVIPMTVTGDPLPLVPIAEASSPGGLFDVGEATLSLQGADGLTTVYRATSATKAEETP